MSPIRGIKNAIFPKGVRYYRVLTGISAGCMLKLDLQNQFRRYLGVYEREIAPFVRSYSHAGDCCYDIGSALCDYTVAFGKLVGGGGTVYSIDASPELFDQISEIIAKNPHIKAQIVPINAFVGDKHDSRDHCLSIDGMVEQMKFKVPDLIKMDIEGGEVAALRGAQHTLRQHHPKLIIEVHSLSIEQECLTLLRAANYAVTIIDQRPFFGRGEFRPAEHNRWICAE